MSEFIRLLRLDFYQQFQSLTSAGEMASVDKDAELEINSRDCVDRFLLKQDIKGAIPHGKIRKRMGYRFWSFREKSVDAITKDDIFEEDLTKEAVRQNEQAIVKDNEESMRTDFPDSKASEQLGRVLEKVIASSAQKAIAQAMPDLLDQIVRKIREKNQPSENAK